MADRKDQKDQKQPARGRGGGRGRGRGGNAARGRGAQPNAGRGRGGGRGGGRRGGGGGGGAGGGRGRGGGGGGGRGGGGRGGSAGSDGNSDAQYRAMLSDVVKRVGGELEQEVKRNLVFDVTRYNRDGRGLVYVDTYDIQHKILSSIIPDNFAKFTCTNAKCRASWASAKAGYCLRACAADAYPTVNKLWIQDCKKCGGKAQPRFDDLPDKPAMQWFVQKLERVLSIMAGIRVEEVVRDDDANDDKPPHEFKLCELCKTNRYCTMAQLQQGRAPRSGGGSAAASAPASSAAAAATAPSSNDYDYYDGY